MKFRLLIAALVVSVLLNAGGIVFLCLYIGEVSRTKAVKKELRVVKSNLNLVRSAPSSDNSSSSSQTTRYTYVSHATGAQDFMEVTPATLAEPTKDHLLIVYLHGMGSSYTEPFFSEKHEPVGPPLVERYPHTILLSCNYGGKSSWGKNDALADITQNIHFLMEQYPIKKIILFGNSMGGCASLTYAISAPPEIKEKIIGIVSSESTGDLTKLFNETSLPSVQAALAEAFGGPPMQVPQIYREKSLIPNIDKLPTGVRIAVISAAGDTLIPSELQRELIAALDEHHVPHKLIKIEGKHGEPPTEAVLEAYDFADGRDD